MKKTILFLIVLVLILSLFGCEKEGEIIGCRAPQCNATGENEILTFLKDARSTWIYEQAEESEEVKAYLDDLLGSKTNEIGEFLFPSFRSDGYVLKQINIYRWEVFYQYQYYPQNVKADKQAEEFVELTIFREPNSFAAKMEELELTAENGIARTVGFWYWNYKGYCVMIDLRPMIDTSDWNALAEELDFRVYSVSDDGIITRKETITLTEE